jgi:hypothetical protein
LKITLWGNGQFLPVLPGIRKTKKQNEILPQRTQRAQSKKTSFFLYFFTEKILRDLRSFVVKKVAD